MQNAHPPRRMAHIQQPTNGFLSTLERFLRIEATSGIAVGVLALLCPRIPRSVRLLLLALAIIDDIAAVLVIAVFYSEQLSAFGG